MIGCDPDMCRTPFDHFQDRVENPCDGAERLIVAVISAALSIKVTE
jgi:hypothetical protein